MAMKRKSTLLAMTSQGPSGAAPQPVRSLHALPLEQNCLWVPESTRFHLWALVQAVLSVTTFFLLLPLAGPCSSFRLSLDVTSAEWKPLNPGAWVMRAHFLMTPCGYVDPLNCTQ